MEGLRKLLDIKDSENTNKVHDKNHEPEVEVIGDGAVGGAIPKVNSYKCEKCPFSASNINILNKHIRQEHISTLYPCVICDYQAKSMHELRNHKMEHDNSIPTSKFQCGKLWKMQLRSKN